MKKPEEAEKRKRLGIPPFAAAPSSGAPFFAREALRPARGLCERGRRIWPRFSLQALFMASQAEAVDLGLPPARWALIGCRRLALEQLLQRSSYSS